MVQRTTRVSLAQASPALESQTVPANGQSVQLRFDNPIYRNLLPGTDAFTVTVDGAPLDIGSLAASSDSRTLTLAVTPTIRSGRAVRVSYTTPTTGNVLEGRDGVNVEDFAVGANNSSTVTASDTGVGPAPVSASVAADGLAVVLSFDEALFTGQPVPERLTITVNGVAAQPALIVSGDTSSQIEFYLEGNNRFRQGQTVTISYTDPPGNQAASVIQDPDGNDAPALHQLPGGEPVGPAVPECRPAAGATDSGVPGPARQPRRDGVHLHTLVQRGVPGRSDHRAGGAGRNPAGPSQPRYRPLRPTAGTGRSPYNRPRRMQQ